MEDVIEWHLADRCKSATTAENHARRWRRLTRLGVDWARFREDPEYALQVIRTVVARRRREGASNHALRADYKAINWVVEFCNAHSTDRTWRRWKLPREPPSTPATYTPEQVSRLLAYEHRDPIIQARRRALMSLHAFIGLRPIEMGRAQVSWLDPAGWYDNRQPAKGGQRRRLPFPPSLMQPGGALYEWLKIRPAPKHAPDALWTTNLSPSTPHTQPIKPDRLHQEFNRVRRELGFACNATRMRRYRWGSVFTATGDLGLAAYGLGDTFTGAQRYLTRLDEGTVRERLEHHGLL